MAPRTIIYTGTGGAGGTAVAAATARRVAAAGARTIVLALGPPRALAEALGTDVGPEPHEVSPGLRAQQVRPGDELDGRWGATREWLASALAARGADGTAGEEIAIPPGMAELGALLALRRCWEADDADVVVVAGPSTSEMLRLLALPETIRWWLERMFPRRLRITGVAGSLTGALRGLPAPGEGVRAEVHGLARDLLALNELLGDDERTSVRPVLTPDRAATRAARDAATGLGLYGHRVDAIVVNRVLPAAAGPYFAATRERQAAELDRLAADFAPLPVLRAPLFAEEVTGPAMLDRLGDALFADSGPLGDVPAEPGRELTLTRTGADLRLALPFAQADDVSLRKRDLELIVRVAGHRRTLALPPALADYRATGATVRDGALHVRFDRDRSTVPDA